MRSPSSALPLLLSALFVVLLPQAAQAQGYIQGVIERRMNAVGGSQVREPKFGESTHQGVIAVPGVVRYLDGRPSLAATAQPDYVVYNADGTISPLTGDESCTASTCEVISGSEMCAIHTRFTELSRLEVATGHGEPQFRSFDGLCSALPQCFDREQVCACMGQDPRLNLPCQCVGDSAPAACGDATHAPLPGYAWPFAGNCGCAIDPSLQTYLLRSPTSATHSCLDAQVSILATWSGVQPVVEAAARASCGVGGASALVNTVTGQRLAAVASGSIAPYVDYISPVAESDVCGGAAPLNSFVQEQNRFFACSPSNIVNQSVHVWSPIKAYVEYIMPSGNVLTSHTNGSGHYSMLMRGVTSWPEDGLPDHYFMTAYMRFAPFSTRRSDVRIYRLGDMMGGIGRNTHTNIPVNATLVSGTFSLVSGQHPVTTVSGSSAWAVDGNYWPQGSTRYFSPGSQNGTGGQLSSIAQLELRDTSVYVYRAADGKLLGSRWGLSQREIACRSAQTTFECDERLNSAGTSFSGSFQVLARGTTETRVESQTEDTVCGNAQKFCSSPEQFLPTLDVELDYRQDAGPAERGIRSGDALEVVVINEATGYIGTSRTGLGNVINASATLAVPSIVMRAPQLRIWAQRRSASDQRDYRVGSEGAGLTSDEEIIIYTEWLDHDGGPLPEGLMMTGRLAVSSSAAEDVEQGGGPKKLQAVGQVSPERADLEGQARMPDGQFRIIPGLHTIVFRTPQSDLGATPQHFYVHVDGANPEALHSAEGSQPRPAPADFSDSETCYYSTTGARTCVPRNIDGASDDGESEAMLQRPWTHVPVLVPVYDSGATQAAKDQAKANRQPAPGPIYAWVRRPEYHFSLLELESLTLTRTLIDNSTDTTPLIVGNETVTSSQRGTILRSDARLDIVSVLNTNSQDELIRFGTPRNAVWMLGDTAAHVGEDGRTYFENLRTLSANDLMALSLVQDDDPSNLLWTHKFDTIDYHLAENATSISVGSEREAIAITSPEGAPVEWRIVARDAGIVAKVQTLKVNTALVTVGKKSAEGYFTLEARLRQSPNVKIRKKVHVGCDCEVCDSPGNCELEIASVHARWSVGRMPVGGSAGSLFLEGHDMVPALGRPASLTFSTMAEDVEVIRTAGAIRQIVAPTSFVDVAVLNPSSYQMRFYEPSAVGAAGSDGVHAISAAVQPLASWTVTYAADTLEISGTHDGKQETSLYRRNPSTGEWSLSRGTGADLERTTRSETQQTSDRVVYERVEDASGNIASERQLTYRAVGQEDDPEATTQRNIEELVLEIADPNGSPQTTRTTYEPAGAGRRLQTVEYPDGSWVRYAYAGSDDTRVSVETRPWLNGAITDVNGVRTISYSYDAVDGREDPVAPSPPIPPAVALPSVQTPSEAYRDRPRRVIERVGGVEVSRTYFAYFGVAGGGRGTVVERAAAPGASYGASGNLRTTTVYAPPDAADPSRREPERLRSVQHADGRLDSYDVVRGSWTGGAFRAGVGPAVRETVTHGTASQPGGVSGKSTREVRIEDAQGDTVREETWANVGGSYTLMRWSQHTYDRNHRRVRSVHSNGTENSASWGCCGYDTQTDEQGNVTTYTYDAHGRVRSETRGSITTTHFYDSAGRELSTRRASSAGTFTSSRSYDRAGRLQTSTDESGLTTLYAYSSDGRTTTVTRPDGSTEVTLSNADGSVASVTGSGVVAQYTSHALLPDGSQSTEVRVGSAGSTQFERTITDILGRTVRSERPGFGGTLEVSQTTFNANGQVARQDAPGVAATLFAYDALGAATQTALDVNGDGTINLDGVDRVQETNTAFVSRAGGVWQETVQRVYATASSSQPTLVSTQRSRQSGFSGGLVSESESVDLNGNVTTSRSLLNPATATVTSLVNVPDSDTDQITVSVQGRVVMSTSASGLATAFTYDGFDRRIGVIDPRTGTSVTHYDAQGRVDYVEDSAGRRTRFGYDVAGRKVWESNVEGKVTRFAYSARGELVRTWGDVPYPVSYEYDSQGRRRSMRTYREPLAWNAVEWPQEATGDATTWEFEPATGLLLAKRDASGQAVTYSYGAGGRLATRRWARLVAGAPLVTSYGYLPSTGELALVDYSDATPDVSFNYDRLGRTTQVVDGVGTLVMAYDPATLALASETRTGLVPSTLTYKHATSGVVGRSTGFSLGSDYDVTYSHDTKGRMNTVAWNIAGQSDSVLYTRLPNSELLQGVTYASGLTTTYGYENTRDLKTQVRNRSGAATVSQYDYTYDGVGRRSSVANSGSAFAQNAFNRWTYNDRNELIESGRFLGTNVAQTTSPVASEHRAYSFDPIGNRITASEGAESDSYAANGLNAYTSVAGVAHTYDADGNLTGDGTRRFGYDAENRLTLVEPIATGNGSVRVRMAYDYLGRRVQKSVEEYDGAAWSAQDDVQFVYLGWNVIEERRTRGGVSTKKSFVWGLDLSRSMDGAGGIGGLLAVVDETGTQMAFVYDANGNVGQLVEEGGSAVATYEYDAFGNVLAAGGAAANDNAYLFSTKYADQETGLVYYGYRYYSPSLGRWVNRDPAGEDGGFNILAFVANRPLDRFDLLGLEIRPAQVAAGMSALKEEIDALLRHIERRKSGGGVSVERLWKSCCVDDVDFDEDLRLAVLNMRNRYLWTNSGGWIDLGHLLAAALKPPSFVPGFVVEWGGLNIEEAQASAGRASAFGGEDLPSNRYGVSFGSSELDTSNLCRLSDQLERFINGTLGGAGAAPTADIDRFNLIRNFTAEPILSVSGADIVVDAKTGVPYKGAVRGNVGAREQELNTAQFAYERKWLDIMRAHGISGTSAGSHAGE